MHDPQVCTAKMNLSDEVDLEDYVSRPDKISAADISAICQEAGMHAVRKNRWVVGWGGVLQGSSGGRAPACHQGSCCLCCRQLRLSPVHPNSRFDPGQRSKGV